MTPLGLSFLNKTTGKAQYLQSYTSALCRAAAFQTLIAFANDSDENVNVVLTENEAGDHYNSIHVHVLHYENTVTQKICFRLWLSFCSAVNLFTRN